FDEIQVKDFVLVGDIPAYSQTGFNVLFPSTWSLYDTVGCLENYLRSNGMPYDTIYVGIDNQAQNPFATVTDTLYASTFSESPWVKRQDSVWVRFADDPVYNLYQKTFIEFLPILRVPRADSLSMVEEISNDNTIKLYPNPAENTLNIESQDIIKEIEFYDALGKKAKAITLNKKEAIIDISSFAKGNYIVNLINDKGKIKKKLVVK
ncbi:MAG: T9SS type A sorting domain-containing protein, partial [Bacteroidales bacterium]|nr:T9SS type A sorting domain-containing protein [Bacteroidales bacterium]